MSQSITKTNKLIAVILTALLAATMVITTMPTVASAATTTPGKVSIIRACRNGTSDSIEVTWKGLKEKPTGYEVWQKSGIGEYKKVKTKSGDKTTTYIEARKTTSHAFKVRAYNKKTKYYNKKTGKQIKKSTYYKLAKKYRGKKTTTIYGDFSSSKCVSISSRPLTKPRVTSEIDTTSNKLEVVLTIKNDNSNKKKTTSKYYITEIVNGEIYDTDVIKAGNADTVEFRDSDFEPYNTIYKVKAVGKYKGESAESNSRTVEINASNLTWTDKDGLKHDINLVKTTKSTPKVLYVINLEGLLSFESLYIDANANDMETMRYAIQK